MPSNVLRFRSFRWIYNDYTVWNLKNLDFACVTTVVLQDIGRHAIATRDSRLIMVSLVSADLQNDIRMGLIASRRRSQVSSPRCV